MPPKARVAAPKAQTKKAPAAANTNPATSDVNSQSQAPVNGETQDATAMPPPARKRRHSHSTDPSDTLLEPFYYGKGLTDPINTARDKWNLLPAFLKVKGLVKQHIDSYNFFVDTELKTILRANATVHSDVDPNMFIRYTDIRIGKPERVEDRHSTVPGLSGPGITPNECRLRDLTYSAPIYVNFESRSQSGLKMERNVYIGRMPVMLRSNKCVLSGRSEKEMGLLNECAVDPGGYFVVRGQEKVILVQEQLSK
ncbi:beta and beta-prime subunits of DNA dependent RNA-polymerase, partial [Aureobasidium melanogenum]